MHPLWVAQPCASPIFRADLKNGMFLKLGSAKRYCLELAEQVAEHQTVICFHKFSTSPT
jgi:hypothetical protein